VHRKVSMSNTSEFIQTTSIPGLLVLKRPTHKDERGFFREVFHLDELEQASGVNFKLAQWNHSLSKPKVIRALHAENWNKIVYPVSGSMFSAVVDIRPDSPTFGKIETFSFSDNERYALFIPKGVANSICTVGEEDVNYLYLVDSYYDGSDTRAVAWDDPDLAIDWPTKDPIISQRDQNNPKLRELFPAKFK
jgi:dTDP-4-dehydrorhamnose 3,5-epimerase